MPMDAFRCCAMLGDIPPQARDRYPIGVGSLGSPPASSPSFGSGCRQIITPSKDFPSCSAVHSASFCPGGFTIPGSESALLTGSPRIMVSRNCLSFTLLITAQYKRRWERKAFAVPATISSKDIVTEIDLERSKKKRKKKK